MSDAIPDTTFRHFIQPYTELRRQATSKFQGRNNTSNASLTFPQIASGKFCWFSCFSAPLESLKTALREDVKSFYSRLGRIDNEGQSEEVERLVLKLIEPVSQRRVVDRTACRQVEQNLRRILGYGETKKAAGDPTRKRFIEESEENVRCFLNDIENQAASSKVGARDLLKAVLTSSQARKPQLKQSGKRFFTGWKLLDVERKNGSKCTIDEADLLIINAAGLVKKVAEELCREPLRENEISTDSAQQLAAKDKTTEADAKASGFGDRSTFHSLYNEDLSGQTRWTWSLQAGIAASSHKLSALRSTLVDIWNRPRDTLAALKDWSLAHIWHGVMSSGKGIHYRDINRVHRERAQNCDTLMRAAPMGPSPSVFNGKDDSARHKPQNAVVRDPIGFQRKEAVGELQTWSSEIHQDMLRSLHALEKQLAPFSKRGFWGNIRYRFRVMKLFLRFLWRQRFRKNFFRDRPAAPASLAEAIGVIHQRHKTLFPLHVTDSTQPELSAALLKSLHRLKEQARALCIDPRDFGMISDQLIQDQATIEKIAGIIRERAGDRRDRAYGTACKKIEETLARRKASLTQILRQAGFVRHEGADHAIRAIDYILSGLANPRHKLNRALSCGGKFRREDIPSLYAEIISKLPKDHEINLGAGWGRGIRIESWFAAPLAKLTEVIRANFGLHFGARYSFKIKKTEAGMEFTFGRSATTSLAVKIYLYLFENVISKKTDTYLAAALKAQRQRRRNDELTIKFNKDSMVASQQFLQDVLSGQLDDPYVLLEKGSGTASLHAVESEKNISLQMYPGWRKPIIDRDEKGDLERDVRLMGGGAVYGGFSSKLYGKVTGKGRGYDSETGKYNTLVTSQSRSFEWPSFFFELGAMPRMQYGDDNAAVAQRGEAFAGVSRSAPPVFTNIEKSRALLKPKTYKITPGETVSENDASLDDVTWDVAFARDEKILKLFDQHKESDKEIHKKIKEWVSYTTTDQQRENIQTATKGFYSCLKFLASSFGEKSWRAKHLSNRLHSLAMNVDSLEKRHGDFLRHDDRAVFEKKIKNISERARTLLWSGHVDRKDLSKRQYGDDLKKVEKAVKPLLDHLQPDPSLWREDDLGDEIKISMKLKGADTGGGTGLANLSQSGLFNKMEKLKEEADERQLLITEITGSGTRHYETSFDFPFLFAADSNAKLTMKKSETIYSHAESVGGP